MARIHQIGERVFIIKKGVFKERFVLEGVVTAINSDGYKSVGIEYADHGDKVRSETKRFAPDDIEVGPPSYKGEPRWQLDHLSYEHRLAVTAQEERARKAAELVRRVLHDYHVDYKWAPSYMLRRLEQLEVQVMEAKMAVYAIDRDEVPADGSKCVTCCDAEFETVEEAKQHEIEHTKTMGGVQ